MSAALIAPMVAPIGVRAGFYCYPASLPTLGSRGPFVAAGGAARRRPLRCCGVDQRAGATAPSARPQPIAGAAAISAASVGFSAAQRGAMSDRPAYFLFGAWPDGVFDAANGLTLATPPFLAFLSAFGFFFSLLLFI
ncbi:hypothetical protein OO17_25575 [Rhodopseudomonas palustris]|uniref:Uncharacterized protein n=1 Tax=Rhodopseudomonas palustris TaxID=1076 RepID=A0A0D7E514_RHOPL|nr:hypothetical protein OO17_25575 [Rhodopseudomonas palustris]